MEILTTTQIKEGLFRFDDNWVRVDDVIDRFSRLQEDKCRCESCLNVREIRTIFIDELSQSRKGDLKWK